MEKLKQNYTTPEQAKRLLVIGVSADSSDMCWTTNGGFPFKFPRCVPYKMFQEKEHHIPCWSVGRLIEILSKTYKFHTNRSYIYDLVNDYSCNEWINEIEIRMKDNSLDFSKLYLD